MTTDAYDDVLRDALAAEAATARLMPDWGDVEARATRSSRRPPLAAIAAAVAIVTIAVGAVALTRDEPDSARVTTDPPVVEDGATTLPDRPMTPVASPGRVVDPFVIPSGAPLAPDELVAVIDAGDEGGEASQDLVVLDASGALVRTLSSGLDTHEGGIFAVGLTPDRATLLFAHGTSACGSLIQAIAVDGSTSTVDLFPGSAAALSPDGTMLAVDLRDGCAAPDRIELLPVAGGTSTLLSIDDDENSTLGSVAFLDDEMLWFTHGDPDAGATLQRFDLQTRETTRIDPVALGGSYERLDAIGDGTMTVVHRCCGDAWSIEIVDDAGVIASSAVGGPRTNGALTSVGSIAADGFTGDRTLYVNGEPIRSDVLLVAVLSEPQRDRRPDEAPTITVLPGATSLTTAQTLRATRVVADFVSAFGRGDFATAATIWDGYPDVTPDRPVGVADWLEDLAGEVSWPFQGNAPRSHVVFVTPAWSSADGAAVVTHVYEPDGDGTSDAISFLVGFDEDGNAEVVRLPDNEPAPIRPDHGATVGARDRIEVDGVPTEGGVRAFIGGIEVETVVDYDAFTTTVTVPEGLSGEFVLIVSFATPEAPTASSYVFRAA